MILELVGESVVLAIRLSTGNIVLHIDSLIRRCVCIYMGDF